MRSCPICNNPERETIEKEYNYTSKINGGVIPLLSLYECIGCGFHYLDNESVNQAWFDWYYLTVYQTDDKPYSNARLDSLAECVANSGVKNTYDIGGMDGELAQRLYYERKIGCAISGVGDIIHDKFESVILSHTLEHIYDIPAMMKRVKDALKPGGFLFIEVPIHLGYSDAGYDKHWQHINKFRPQDLGKLLFSNGFTLTDSYQLPNYREYKVWRIVGRYEQS